MRAEFLRRAASRPAGAALLLAVPVVALYLPFLSRPFVSEDLPLVRFLLASPPWADVGSWLLGPWLGIEVVRFWRPVSTALLAFETQLFGARPLPYHLVHLAVHLLNAVLLWRVAAGIERRVRGGDGSTPGLAPIAAAGLFALHPLHPNAVWIASFATLFGATFQLLALAEYQRFRDTGRRRRLAAALAATVLALGSYEAAAALPALLVAHEHLLGRGRRGLRDHARSAAAYLPFLVLGAGYLVFRSRLFGEVLGGYSTLGARFRSTPVASLAGDLGSSLQRLLVPWYETPATLVGTVAVVGLLAAGPALLRLAGLRGDRWRRELGAWVFGWAWAVLALAPFAFEPFVPGNGRYAYVAAMGAAVALGRLVPTAAEAGSRPGLGPRWPRLAAAGLVLVLLVVWTALLAANVAVYRRAGATAEAVADGLAAAAEPDAGGAGGPVFAVGYPVFVENAAGVPLAQVYHYGLADAVRPPFRATRLAVHPLPLLAASDLAPVAGGLPAARLLAWDGDAGRFRRVVPEAAGEEIRAWRDERAGAAAGEVAFVPPEGAPGLSFRLIVSSRGNPAFVDVAPPVPPGSPARAPLPPEFVASMRRLYRGEIYWWVEGRGPEGRLLAWSRARPL